MAVPYFHKVVAVYKKGACVSLFFPYNKLHKGTFTCTRSAYDKDEFARIYSNINIFKCVGAGFVCFGNAFKLNNRLLCSTYFLGVNKYSSFLKVLINI